MKHIFVFLAICILVLSFFATAQVPQKISYQGLLTTSSGQPVQDGSYDLKFEIYNLPSGGTLRYKQTSSGVSVSKGTFSVILGPMPAIFSESLFVEVTALAGSPGIGSDITFSPRSELTSAPYAFHCWKADTASVGIVTYSDTLWKKSGVNIYHLGGNVGIGTANPQGLLQVGEPFIVTPGEDVGISWPGNPEYTPDAKLEIVRQPSKDLFMLSSTAAADGDLVIVKNNGNVGIGTAAPVSKLHIVDQIATSNGQVVKVDFNNAVGSIQAEGIHVEATPLASKGDQLGVLANVSSAVGEPQTGAAEGRLAKVHDYVSEGVINGVVGLSIPSVLSNWDATRASSGLGGFFRASPAPGTISLDGIGTYWVGGAYGEVSGQVDGNPGLGAVAGVIGVNNNTGNAPSWAGYFRGRSAFTYGNGAPVNLESGVSMGTAYNNRHGLWINTSNNLIGDVSHAALWIENTGLGGFTFYAADQAGLDPTPFVITNDGNVGIGTATPVNKLDVAGQARIRSLPDNISFDDIVVSDVNGVLHTRNLNTVGLGDPVDDWIRSNPNATTGTELHTVNGVTAVFVDPGQRLQSGSAGGARILGNQGNTPASPAIGFFSTNGISDGGGGNGIFRPVANEMAFATQSAERMRIASGGNIGIGTTSPTQKLDVAGTAQVTGFKMPTGAVNGYVLTSNASGVGTWQQASTGGITSTCGIPNYIPKMSSSTNISCSQLFDNGTNVGLGTASPEFKLSIQNDGGILAKGTFGSGVTLTTSGNGVRFFWYPRKAAFRAGQVSATEWDNVNVGLYSSAMGYNTIASGLQSTAFGSESKATGHASTAVGLGNTASGEASIAIGGDLSTASGQSSAAIGSHNTASGDNSTAIGYITTASGNVSTAMGYNVSTNLHKGAFIIGDFSVVPVSNSTADNQMTMRFAGGYRLFSNSALTAGVSLAAGGGSWLSISDSTKKQNIRLVDGKALLEKVSQLPVKQWSYKSQDPSIEHIGPMAQDFYRIFHIGESNTTISTIDPSGIALAAVQELYKQNQTLSAQNAELNRRVTELETIVKSLAAEKKEPGNKSLGDLK